MESTITHSSAVILLFHLNVFGLSTATAAKSALLWKQSSKWCFSNLILPKTVLRATVENIPKSIEFVIKEAQNVLPETWFKFILAFLGQKGILPIKSNSLKFTFATTWRVREHKFCVPTETYNPGCPGDLIPLFPGKPLDNWFVVDSSRTSTTDLDKSKRVECPLGCN